MNELTKITSEKIIKSKKRIQKHGEVFTPKKIVNQMLDLPNMREACQNITSTFLEPAAGEGTFLVEILIRKLYLVSKHYNDDLTRYENYSLLALTSLYGVELLEDNAQKCVMNMYQIFYDYYLKQAIKHNAKVKNKVLDSAKLIISKNIAQGNFLTKKSANGNPIVFSEWKPIKLKKNTKTIRVYRTEYTIEEILNGIKKENGSISEYTEKFEQLSLFDLTENDYSNNYRVKKMKYIPVKIVDVYKEEMEEDDG